MTTPTTTTPPAAASAPPPAAPPAAAPAAAPAEPTSLLKQALVPPAETEIEPAKEPAKSEPAKDAAPAEKPGVKVKLPEGFQVDDGALKTFTELATEAGLDDAKAQKFFDQYVSLEKSRLAAHEQRVVEQDKKWAAQVQADPELGGAKLKESLTLANRAIARFGLEEPVDALHAAGLGNHPAILRMFVEVGKALAEDRVAGATGKTAASPERVDNATALYGKKKK